MNETTTQYRRVHPVLLALAAASSCVNTLFVILMTFASYIATGVYGATAVLAGTILTGSRMFDAVTDPLIGLLTDRISTRFGRCRPLAVVGYVVTALAVLAMFVICPGKGKIGVFVLLYLLYIVGYTLFSVGNNMIGPIITNDPKQRPIFGRWLSVYVTILSTMFSVVLSKTLMPKHGYQLGLPLFKDLAWIVVIAGAVLLAISIVAVSVAKADRPENYVNVKTEKVGFRDMVNLLSKNRPMQMYTIAAASDKLALQTASQSSITVMVFGIVIGNYSFNGEISIYNMFVTLIMLFVAAKLAGDRGMKRAIIFWTRLAIVGYAVMFFFMLLTDTLSITTVGYLRTAFIVLFCAMNALRMATTCVTDPLRYDVIDYEFTRTGAYMPAVVNTVYAFIDKLISSLATTIVAVAVSTIGYVNAMPQATDPYSQPVFFVAMFLWLGMPVLGYVCTLIAMRFYTLDKETMAEVQKTCAQMRAAKSDS
ncbi:MAG: MFS transporter [Oscillospiraceae bacterium]|nr:MFS transporter [Oscillospiraceae bacterium]